MTLSEPAAIARARALLATGKGDRVIAEATGRTRHWVRRLQFAEARVSLPAVRPAEGGPLLRYEAACRALAEAKAVDEVKDVLDKAIAVEMYGRQAKNRELELDAAEIRFRAERRIGQLEQELRAADMIHKGGRPAKTGTKTEPVSAPALMTLEQLGIDKKLSSRGQKLAAVPAAKFERMLGDLRERVRDETDRVTRDLIKEGEKAERRQEHHRTIDHGGTVADLHALIARGVTFATLAADPPWQYETWSERGQDRSAIQYYHTQPTAEIAALPVAKLAAPDSILHLCCLSSMLPDALTVMAAWGFTFKKVGFIWIKTNADGSRHMGNGKWTRDEAELCLLGTRGAPTRLDAGIRQTFDAPLGAHSEKPAELFTRIAALTAGPYLELYGRAPRAGWTVWGDQVRWVAGVAA